MQDCEGNLSEAQLTRLIGGKDIVITGWGAPVFSRTRCWQPPTSLKLIAHSAGTIKRLLPPPVFADGRRVTHAAAAMAIPVAETTLLLILLCLRRFHKIDRAFKEEGWAPAQGTDAGYRIGRNAHRHHRRRPYRARGHQEIECCGCGAVALRSIRERVGCGCHGYTQSGSGDAAARMSRRHFAGASHGRDLPHVGRGAVRLDARRGDFHQHGSRRVLSTRTLCWRSCSRGGSARRWMSSRQEPLPNESLFRQLDNVIITPHVASVTHQARHRQGTIITDEVASFLQDGKLRFEVTRAMLETMA